MTSPQTSIWKRDLSPDLFRKGLERFLRWEKEAFCGLFPPHVLARLMDRGERELILRADGDGQLWFATGDGLVAPIGPDELAQSTLSGALAARGVARDAARIALELEPESFFVRRFDFPAVAKANLPRLLAAEIERKTPFKPADVLFGHALEPIAGAADKLRATLCILRRDLFEAAVARSGVAAGDIDLVRPASWPEGAPPVIVVGRAERESKGFRIAAFGLAGLAAALFALAVGTAIWRQDRQGAELDARLSEVSTRAAHVRKLAERATAESRLLATLREERAQRPTLADCWEELSRILPDGSYVIEMQLHESKPGEMVIDLVGLSDSAVNLPALLDQSPLFSDAALTAPITPDPQEKRERFSLRMVVKALGAGKTK